MQPALTGFATGFSLILAIGAQNAFVLRQGLMRAHVFWICLACALSDAVLISLGVAGFGAASGAVPWLPALLRWAGAAFLVVYGALRFRSALNGGATLVAAASAGSLWASLVTCLILTWANPHVYLDTFGLIGAVSTSFAGAVAKTGFAAGAILSSFTFFFALGYGARALGPLMRRPGAWRVLDTIIA
ncbi:MAG: amino acid transporter, partial [Alphaproteobacteria bacterium]